MRLLPLLVLIAVMLAAPVAGAQPRPSRIVSINLCTDQLLMKLADRDQIRSVTYMARDERVSLIAEEARSLPGNNGEAEEVLAFRPDLVLGGTFTSRFTVALMRKLDYRVVVLEPANDVASIQENIRIVAGAVGHPERGRAMIAEMNAALAALQSSTDSTKPKALIYRAGGRVAGRPSLGDAALTLAGFDNLTEELGLGSWGSLSIEGLLRAEPDLLILNDRRGDAPSQGRMILRHPALRRSGDHFQTASLQSQATICGTPQLVAAARALRQSYERQTPHDQ